MENKTSDRNYLEEYKELNSINEKVKLIFTPEFKKIVKKSIGKLDFEEVIEEFSKTLSLNMEKNGIILKPADNYEAQKDAGAFKSALMFSEVEFVENNFITLILDPSDDSLRVKLLDLVKMKVHGDLSGEMEQKYLPYIDYQKKSIMLYSIIKDNRAKDLFNLDWTEPSLFEVIKNTKDTNLLIFKKMRNRSVSLERILNLYSKTSGLMDEMLEADLSILSNLDNELNKLMKDLSCRIEKALNETYKFYEIDEVNLNDLFIGDLNSRIWFKDELREKRLALEDELYTIRYC